MVAVVLVLLSSKISKMFASTLLSNIPILSEANNQAYTIDELLFGEAVQILQNAKDFVFVRHLQTQTEGYVKKNQLISISDEYAREFQSGIFLRLASPLSALENERTGIQNYISAGSICGINKESISLGEDLFSYTLPSIFLSNSSKKEDLLRDAALIYLNTPERKGGRTIFGIDSTLFLTQVFSYANTFIGNTLQYMITHGQVIDFIHEIKCGDVAFFEDEHNQIIHAGICIGENWILHCDGKVKSGRLDQQGLFDPKENGYIYTLRLIKRYF